MESRWGDTKLRESRTCRPTGSGTSMDGGVYACGAGGHS